MAVRDMTLHLPPRRRFAKPRQPRWTIRVSIF
jgi:hypothetical protein